METFAENCTRKLTYRGPRSLPYNPVLQWWCWTHCGSFQNFQSRRKYCRCIQKVRVGVCSCRRYYACEHSSLDIGRPDRSKQIIEDRTYANVQMWNFWIVRWWLWANWHIYQVNYLRGASVFPTPSWFDRINSSLDFDRRLEQLGPLIGHLMSFRSIDQLTWVRFLRSFDYRRFGLRSGFAPHEC